MNKKTWLIICSLITFDQVIKYNIIKYATIKKIILIPNFLTINYLKNYGISFSLFNNKQFIIIIISLFMIYTMVVYLKLYFMDYHYRYSLIFMISGAIGNLIDRIRLGYVIDYIAITINNYSFAIFNLADIMLVCSTLYLIIYILKFERRINVNNNSR